ncbi:hypothetical protein [Kutzneria buriramensis]|uniref:Uncharacterized protein n=1 Tax=Kutzneria buriramensis TaxID=1045776 RepID=A0A3E0HBE8_9PSEU|nr:hypothetical protein BCF44_11154 [Kutzneria buriramensis]
MDDGWVTEPREQPKPTRRLDEVFGEVLPETTSDERDPDRRGRDADSWYEENRPPHHEDR